MRSPSTRLWPLRQDVHEHPSQPSPMPGQNLPKYSPVMEYWSKTQPNGSISNTKLKHRKLLDASFNTSRYTIYLSTNRHYHPARRRCHQKVFWLAPAGGYRTSLHLTKTSTRPIRTQRKQKSFPATRVNPNDAKSFPIHIVTQEKVSAGVSKPGTEGPRSIIQLAGSDALPSNDSFLQPAPSMSSRLTTPEKQIQVHDATPSSSELSSVPESLGSTPEGFKIPPIPQSPPNNRIVSPIRRSQRKRNQSAKATEIEHPQTTTKKRRITRQSNDILHSVEDLSEQSSLTDSPNSDNVSKYGSEDSRSTTTRKRKSIESNLDDEETITGANANNRRRPDEGYFSKSTSELRSSPLFEPLQKQIKAEKAREKKFYAELEQELQTECNNEHAIWPSFDRNKVVMYGSDAQTQYTPSFSETARRGGRTNGRGAARGGRGGAGNGKGRGGKARGRGREDDSPEPPLPKKTQTQEDVLFIKLIKARQAKLQKLFNVVGTQQTEILDIISSRDLNRLVKKAKHHKQVPEYDEIVEELNEKMEFAQDLARRQYEIALENETEVYKAERAVVEAQCMTKIKNIHEEYTKGAQGDLIIFNRAVAAAYDETRTQDGSEVDYFPHYHECPEPDQNVRGYNSTRITDEKAFKHHLRTYDDEARRDVIDDDVGPIIQAFAQKNAERRAEEERKKTQTMEALSAEADKQLKKIRGYLIPRPLVRDEDVNSYALSCLADVSEWMAHRYPDTQYIYMPLENGDSFPREALNYDRLPGQDMKVPPTSTLQSQAEAPANGQRNTTAKPAPPVQGTRRSLRNLQPSRPLSRPQSQPPTPVSASPAPSAQALPTGTGPTLAPAPPKLAPTSSTHQSHPKPPPIDTRPHLPSPPERSPVQPPPNHPLSQQGHGLPPLQPRHISQSSLPPPPPPHYGYSQPYSPTHPPQTYPPMTHGAPSPYLSAPQPPPYHPPQYPMPSPYVQPPAQPPYPHYGSPYYPHPPPQQYSFIPPPPSSTPSQSSPVPQPQSTVRGSIPPPPPQDQNVYYPPSPAQNGYHHHHRSLSHPFQPQPPYPPPHQQPPPPQHATPQGKGRARTKAKQPVTFVNQTLATRKAAAEQLAKEEAAAAAEKKGKEKDKGKKGVLKL